MITFIVFLARDIPLSSSANPACMKNTSAAAVTTQTASPAACDNGWLSAADATEGRQQLNNRIEKKT
jgi:hypothetical protein